jgi:hypothetical protein
MAHNDQENNTYVVGPVSSYPGAPASRISPRTVNATSPHVRNKFWNNGTDSIILRRPCKMSLEEKLAKVKSPNLQNQQHVSHKCICPCM